MSAKVLIVGTATDGPVGEVKSVSSLRELKNAFGGEYVETTTLTATATTYTLDFNPQSTVSILHGVNQSNVLYSPAVSGSTVIFGSVGGTGLPVSFNYTPYIGDNDLINSATFCLENGDNSVQVMRVGGSPAQYTQSGWGFQSVYNGSKYNNILITSSSSGVTISGMSPQYPTKTYTGDPDYIAQRINADSYSLLVPVFVTDYTQTIPTINNNLAGGTDGVVDYNSVYDLLYSYEIPIGVCYVVILGHSSYNILNLISQYFEDSSKQDRLFYIQEPDLNKTTAYNGATFAQSVFLSENPNVVTNTFEGLVHGSTPSTLCSCAVSATGSLVFSNVHVGYTSLLTYAGTGALQLYPSNVLNTITFTPPTTGLISGFSFWSTSGRNSLSITGYDGLTPMDAVVTLTGVGSGVSQFVGAQFKKPASSVTLSCLSTPSASGVVIDNLSIGLVPTSGDSDIDSLLAVIKELQIRHSNVSVFSGRLGIYSGGGFYRVNAVNVVPLILGVNDGLLTNKTSKAIALYPEYDITSIDLATSNGINVFRRWIGSDISVHQGVMTDTSVGYVYSSKTAEIVQIACTYLKPFIGSIMSQGTQSGIAAELKNRLSGARGVIIDQVLVDFISDTLRVYISGSISGEILEISFAVGAN